MGLDLKHSFTPGPWKVEAYKFHLEIWPDPGNKLGCGTMIAQTHPWEPGTGKDTDIANATLIAAAPELLAACKAMLAADDELDYPVVVKQARAAIAKAEGR